MSKEAPTQRFEDLWLSPVEQAGDLPLPAKEGQICFVKAEARAYVFQDGKWVGASGGKKKDA